MARLVCVVIILALLIGALELSQSRCNQRVTAVLDVVDTTLDCAQEAKRNGDEHKAKVLYIEAMGLMRAALIMYGIDDEAIEKAVERKGEP